MALSSPARFDPHRYRFRSCWQLPAPPDLVYRVLAEPLAYPAWWPEIRRVRQLTEDSGELTFRSFLPYELRVLARATREDPAARVLAARLEGDLEGGTRWTVTARGDGGSTAVFDEDVVVRKPLMRLLALPGRPAFRANHAVMMRHGRAGLVSYLHAVHWS